MRSRASGSSRIASRYSATAAVQPPGLLQRVSEVRVERRARAARAAIARASSASARSRSLVASSAVPRSEWARASPSSMRAWSSYSAIASFVRPVIKRAVPRLPWRAPLPGSRSHRARELAHGLVGVPRREPRDAELRVGLRLVGQELHPLPQRVDCARRRRRAGGARARARRTPGRTSELAFTTRASVRRDRGDGRVALGRRRSRARRPCARSRTRARPTTPARFGPAARAAVVAPLGRRRDRRARRPRRRRRDRRRPERCHRRPAGWSRAAEEEARRSPTTRAPPRWRPTAVPLAGGPGAAAEARVDPIAPEDRRRRAPAPSPGTRGPARNRPRPRRTRTTRP